MKKLIIGSGVIVFVLILFTVFSNRKKEQSWNFPVVTSAYEKLSIDGDVSKNGIYDPSLEYDEEGTGWMAYSSVGDGKVQTYLAKSTDYGKTWAYVTEINHADEGQVVFEGKELKGSWHNEVSTLLHDPDDSGKEWKLYWHKYFSDSSGERILHFGWIAYKHAPSPLGPWSDEIPLFGADILPLPPYETEMDLSGIHPDLNGIVVYTELGSIYHDKRIYLSLQGHDTKKKTIKIILIASDDHGKTWKYVSTLLNEKDAEMFDGDFFTASSIVEENDRIFLLASPEKTETRKLKFQHRGLVIFEFGDLTKGSLKKDDKGNFIVIKYLKPSMISGGTSDYDEDNTNGGILFSQINADFVEPGVDPSEYKVFQIYSTREKILD